MGGDNSIPPKRISKKREIKMSNSKVEICPHCGQKMVTYRHKLNKVLISALLKLQQAGGKGTVDNLGLTHSEFANMQKPR